VEITVSCGRCGESFAYFKHGRGRRRKYCDKCLEGERDRRRYRHRDSAPLEVLRCKCCRKPFKQKTLKQIKFCSGACGTSYRLSISKLRVSRICECEVCGKRMPKRKQIRVRNGKASTRWHKRRVCSIECRHVLADPHKAARAAGEKKRLQGLGEVPWSDAERAYHRSIREGGYSRKVKAEVASLKRIAAKRQMRYCLECGGMFLPRMGTQKYCSRHSGVYSHSAWLARWEGKDRSRECAWCGVLHSPIRGYGRRLCCSDECDDLRSRQRSSDEKRRRRTVRKGENIDRLVVFRAAGWKCKSCGCDTPQELMGTFDDSAPELDHIKPIAMGGDHCYDNVQLLCRTCNILKGTSSLTSNLVNLLFST